MAALGGHAGQLLGGIFHLLLTRVEEAESKVRALQLVSVTIEVMGAAAQPHLPAIASALPQVWLPASARPLCSRLFEPNKTLPNLI